MLLRIFFNLSLLFFNFALLAQQSYIDYRSPFHPTVTKSGMVVSQNIDSSNIGIEILDMGGNAIDAAVAVGFSLAITLPRAGNLGGGGLSLAAQIGASGLGEWIGDGLTVLQSVPPIVLVLCVATLIIFLTEITSNVATTSTFCLLYTSDAADE